MAARFRNASDTGTIHNQPALQECMNTVASGTLAVVPVRNRTTGAIFDIPAGQERACRVAREAMHADRAGMRSAGRK
jgi:hypothetical protein